MKDFFSIIADLTAIIHIIIVVFLISGTFINLKFRNNDKICNLYIILLLTSAVLNVITLILTKGKNWCVLSFLENYFRRFSGDGIYSSGFIAYYAKIYAGISISDSIINLMIGLIIGLIVIVIVIKKLAIHKHKTSFV